MSDVDIVISFISNWWQTNPLTLISVGFLLFCAVVGIVVGLPVYLWAKSRS